MAVNLPGERLIIQLLATDGRTGLQVRFALVQVGNSRGRRRRILERLNQAKVDHVVEGGMAAVFHRVPLTSMHITMDFTGQSEYKAVGHMNYIVLLGDSIFDNAIYVPGKPAVIAQLQSILPTGWEATLRAVDGSMTASVPGQVADIPASATHLIVSVGGNDGLSQASILQQPATSVAGAIQQLAGLRAGFERDYTRMLQSLLAVRKPLALCTVYDPCFPEPLMQLLTTTVLTLFNDCILRLAITHGLPVLDLRLVCNEAQDYANPIEPGVPGGRKIAAAILNLIQTHDFSTRKTVVYY